MNLGSGARSSGVGLFVFDQVEVAQFNFARVGAGHLLAEERVPPPGRPEPSGRDKKAPSCLNWAVRTTVPYRRDNIILDHN